jgi:hypothetical protein
MRGAGGTMAVLPVEFTFVQLLSLELFLLAQSSLTFLQTERREKIVDR